MNRKDDLFAGYRKDIKIAGCSEAGYSEAGYSASGCSASGCSEAGCSEAGYGAVCDELEV